MFLLSRSRLAANLRLRVTDPNAQAWMDANRDEVLRLIPPPFYPTPKVPPFVDQRLDWDAQDLENIEYIEKLLPKAAAPNISAGEADINIQDCARAAYDVMLGAIQRMDTGISASTALAQEAAKNDRLRYLVSDYERVAVLYRMIPYFGLYQDKPVVNFFKTMKIYGHEVDSYLIARYISSCVGGSYASMVAYQARFNGLFPKSYFVSRFDDSVMGERFFKLLVKAGLIVKDGKLYGTRRRDYQIAHHALLSAEVGSEVHRPDILRYIDVLAPLIPSEYLKLHADTPFFFKDYLAGGERLVRKVNA